jgi:hypothetical protein
MPTDDPRATRHAPRATRHAPRATRHARTYGASGTEKAKAKIDQLERTVVSPSAGRETAQALLAEVDGHSRRAS